MLAVLSVFLGGFFLSVLTDWLTWRGVSLNPSPCKAQWVKMGLKLMGHFLGNALIVLGALWVLQSVGGAYSETLRLQGLWLLGWVTLRFVTLGMVCFKSS
ncbi:MAG: hypothetical protein ACKO37_03430 [Vampirovibrionales bacterium]